MSSSQLKQPIESIRSLKAYISLFKSLEPVRAEDFYGLFDGIVLGPTWYQISFKTLMVLAGLRGWQGKYFEKDGTGVNLCLQNGKIHKLSKMYIKGVITSLIDGKATLALGYHDLTPLRHMVDEIRTYDKDTILGITYYHDSFLRRITMPFALRRKT